MTAAVPVWPMPVAPYLARSIPAFTPAELARMSFADLTWALEHAPRCRLLVTEMEIEGLHEAAFVASCGLAMLVGEIRRGLK